MSQVTEQGTISPVRVAASFVTEHTGLYGRRRQQLEDALTHVLTAFAARVRTEQKEADAKVCDEIAVRNSSGTFNDCSREVRAAEECAAAIRNQ